LYRIKNPYFLGTILI